MSNRERWIIYPLLFFALANAFKQQTGFEIDNSNPQAFVFKYNQGEASFAIRTPLEPIEDKELGVGVSLWFAVSENLDELNEKFIANGITTVDQANLWTATRDLAFPLPPEVAPRFGRQDIPYYTDTTGSGGGAFLSGINHLFCDSSDDTENVFYIIGGMDNQSGGNLVTSLLFQTGTLSGHSYGTYGNIAGGGEPDPGTTGYQARLMYDPNVVSSDFGTGLRGIELTPFMGIARLYGVYDRRNYIAKGGSTFDGDRITIASDPATNLLRTDASKQTLFIRQGGASDVTGSADDHTYVIPSNAIDISRSPNYVSGENFEDLDYVVECVVFGFARGFINKNHHILARRNAGNGVAVTVPATTADKWLLPNTGMCIPSPAPKGDIGYTLYDRTVYQGDPYMTRSGATRTISDYEHRYGEVSKDNALLLNEPIQQTDVNGNLQVLRPNLRELQILASMDFYTTLGTGKIGGKLYKGTVLDVAHKQAVGTRKPVHELQMRPRTFTKGQHLNPSKASIRIQAISGMAGCKIKIYATKMGSSQVWMLNLIENVIWHETTSGTQRENAIANANAITTAINTSSLYITAWQEGDFVRIVANKSGVAGNNFRVEIEAGAGGVPLFPDVTYTDLQTAGSTTTAYFSGGEDIVNNAGNGTSQLDLTGLIERLPLGVLLQDSDFLCENPLNDMASAFVTMPAGIRPPQTLLPLTSNAEEEGTNKTRRRSETSGSSSCTY